MRVTFLVLLVAFCQLPAAELHVTAGAAPGGDGSPGAPLASIQAAAELAMPGDTVRIHAGTYRETVVPARSGTAAQPIVYTGAGDGPVIVSGSDPLGPWTRVPGSSTLWRAAAGPQWTSALNQDQQLFCDGEMLRTARTPNLPVGRGLFHPDRSLSIDTVTAITALPQGSATPWGPVAKGGASRITFTCAALVDPPGSWPVGATLALQPRENQSWGFICVGPILSYQPGTVTAVIYTSIDTAAHAFSRVTTGTPFFLCRGDGHELDAPGEWYLDQSAGQVRVRLPGDADPNRHHLAIKRRDYAFDLSDRAHLIVRDLEIHAATITTDRLHGDGVGLGAWLTHNRGTVDKPDVQGNASAHHLLLERLTVRHVNHFLGTSGNYHTQWNQSSGLIIAGTAHTVRDCIIGPAAGNGIALFGTDHRITGNVIHDVGYSGSLASAIFINETPNNTPGPPIKADRIEIDRNTLVAGGWGLIDGANLYSSDPTQASRIHHNLLDGAGLLTRDVGGIRFVGHTVNDPLRTGPTRIDHNVVRNVVAALGNPIYFDFCDDYVVDHNLIYDSSGGININDGNALTVTNNTMIGFQSGIGGVNSPSLQFNMSDCLVRNNIASGSILAGGGNIAPSYTADHNLGGASSTLFVDPAQGDYRLRADAAAAIDQGSAAVPHPGSLQGAPDLGCLERGHDAWPTTVGRPVPVHGAPTGLIARARNDGTVDLTWSDRTGGTARHLIDRGYRTDHPNGGWEFLTVGSVAPGVTRFVDRLDGAPRTSHYRVRAELSGFSPWATTAAGTLADDTITFETPQGYSGGALIGQGPWNADPFNGSGRGTTVVASDGGGAMARITGNESLIAYGDFATIDPSFDDDASRVRFSVRIRLTAITAGDTTTALAIRVGGYSIWQHSSHAVEIGVRRDGYLFANTAAGWKGLGPIGEFAASTDAWVTISGVLDYAADRIVEVTLNGVAKPSDWPFVAGHARLHDGLWQLLGNVASPSAAVEVDDLRLRIAETPVLWVTALDPALVEAGDPGELLLSCNRPLAQDLSVALTLASDSQAVLADIAISDAEDGSAVDLASLIIPAGRTGRRLRIAALDDGLVDGSESLRLRLVAQPPYRLDPDPLKNVATMRITDAPGGERRVWLRILPWLGPIGFRALGADRVELQDDGDAVLFDGLATGADETFLVVPAGGG